jgi:hypothetical protein
MQIGSTVGTGGGTNRPVQLGHFNSAGAFTGHLTVSTTGAISTAMPNGIEIRATWSGSLKTRADEAKFFPAVNGGYNLGTAALRWGTVFTQSLDASGDVTWVPSASRTLGTNGQFSIEMTSNTAGNLVYRGSDGTTRRMALTFV